MRARYICLAIIVILCCGATALLAEPNIDELASFKVLVPDWSKTSSGDSPALSPDGKTLLYISQDKVWCVHGIDAGNTTANPPEAWKIEMPALYPDEVPVTYPAKDPQLTDYEPDTLQNIDWSPDGTRAAVVYKGRLYVLDHFDYAAKTVNVRMAADGSHEELMQHGKTYNFYMPVESPRWSPSGDRIALIRKCVHDVGRIVVIAASGGEEVTVARDAIDGPSVWGEPWSPDSKYLVYGTMQPLDGDESRRFYGGISIASADGSGTRIISKQPNSAYPSWANTSDRIAYMAPYKHVGVESMLPSIMMTDTQGMVRKPLAIYTPPKERLVSAQAEVTKRLRSVLETRYRGLFTPKEINELLKSGTPNGEVLGILIVGEARLQAKSIGGDFQKTVESARTYASRSGNTAKTSSAYSNLRTDEINEAIKRLPDGRRKEFWRAVMDLQASVERPLIYEKAVLHIAPVWSPSDREIAFVRWHLPSGFRELVLADVQTNRARMLFSAAVINNPRWTQDGKRLLVESNRNISYSSKLATENTLWPELTTMLSYPEIWLIEPK